MVLCLPNKISLEVDHKVDYSLFFYLIYKSTKLVHLAPSLALYPMVKKDPNFSDQLMHINTSMIHLPRLVKYTPIMPPFYYPPMTPLLLKDLHLSHQQPHINTSMISLPNLVKYIPIMTPCYYPPNIPLYYPNRIPLVLKDTNLRHQPMHINSSMIPLLKLEDLNLCHQPMDINTFMIPLPNLVKYMTPFYYPPLLPQHPYTIFHRHCATKVTKSSRKNMLMT